MQWVTRSACAEGATASTENRRRRIAAAAPDLVAEHAGREATPAGVCSADLAAVPGAQQHRQAIGDLDRAGDAALERQRQRMVGGLLIPDRHHHIAIQLQLTVMEGGLYELALLFP